MKEKRLVIMFKAWLQNNTKQKFAWLSISLNILNEYSVVFSDINATDNNVKYFETAEEMLNNLDFDAFRRTGEISRQVKHYKSSQAEIMVKTHAVPNFISLEKIVEI